MWRFHTQMPSHHPRWTGDLYWFSMPPGHVTALGAAPYILDRNGSCIQAFFFPSDFSNLYANAHSFTSDISWLLGLVNSSSNVTVKQWMQRHPLRDKFQNLGCVVGTMMLWESTAGIWWGEGSGMSNVLYKKNCPMSHVTLTCPPDI